MSQRAERIDHRKLYRTDHGFKRRLMPLCQASRCYEKLHPFLERIELGPGNLDPELDWKKIGKGPVIGFRWNPNSGPRLSFAEFLQAYNLVVI